MNKYLKWLCLLFLVLSSVPLYYINTISKGNFLAGPITTILILIPLMIVQLILLMIVWKGNSDKMKKVFTFISFLILIFHFYVLYSYCTEIT